jgi:hypothetical protein
MNSIQRIAGLLEPARTFWPAARTARRALERVRVDALTDREKRLVELAEEFGPEPGFMQRSQMWVYLALALLSFARNRALTLDTRRAAYAAAIALASNTILTLRENMGLDEQLRDLVGLDSELGALALRVVAGRPAGTIHAIERVLDDSQWAYRVADETNPTSE